MKKTYESSHSTLVSKHYSLNKDYRITVFYFSELSSSPNQIAIRLYDCNGDLMGKTEHSKKTLKEIKAITLEMIKNFNEFGQVTLKETKTELQQIKDILVEAITVEQAEKYAYIAIDKDGQTCLFTKEPHIPKTVWFTISETLMIEHVDYMTLLWFDKDAYPELNAFIYNNYLDLCFKIADLKGQN